MLADYFLRGFLRGFSRELSKRLPAGRSFPLTRRRGGGRRAAAKRRRGRAASHELARQLDLLLGGRDHAEACPGFDLNARERLEARLFHEQAAVRLLDSRLGCAQDIEPVGEADLLHAESDEPEYEGHDDAGSRDPGQHGAKPPSVALTVEARPLLVGRGRGPEPERHLDRH